MIYTAFCYEPVDRSGLPARRLLSNEGAGCSSMAKDSLHVALERQARIEPDREAGR